VGQEVLAFGSPEGLEQTVTSGIVSALHRNVPDFSPPNAPNTTPLLDVIQTDAAINPGNSGGPLCDLSGRVVGIDTAIFSESGGSQGLGFAIPVNTARDIAAQLVQSGSVSHAFLGIGGRTVTPDLAEAFGLSVTSGALVSQVYPDSAAEAAGLEQGDVIVELGGETIDSMDDVSLTILRHKVGDRLTVTYVRGSERSQVEAELQERPTSL
jgi:S1-C subfamily serine protease